MKYCTKCGTAIPDVSKFCPKCGTAANSASAPENREPTPPYSYVPEKKSASPLFGVAVAILAVLLVAVAVLGVLILRDGDSDAPQPESTQAGVQSSAPAVTAAPETTAAPAGTPPADGSPSPQPISDITYYVTGADSSLKMRQTPDGSSTVTAKLENGDGVKVLDSSGAQYWEVSVVDGDVTGYIDRNYLTDERSAVTEPVTYYVVNTPAYLSVLDIPAATGYQELTRAYNGDSVTVLAKPKGSFWYVYYSGNYGYVLNDYLSSTAPTPAPTPTPAPARASEPSLSSAIGTAYVYVDTGYLALRNAKSYDTANEIGAMYTGESVYVFDTSGTYWYVYSPSLGRYGYANGNYLQWTPTADAHTASHATRYVKVNSGYLALRTARAYDDANEIGQLYTGDAVEVIDTSDDTYWFVYAPSLGLSGYVNRNYLQ